MRMLILIGLMAPLASRPLPAQSSPPCSAPEYRQFDFWIGDWEVCDVTTLTRYSERGHAYVDDLVALMRQNHLEPVDEAYLKPMGIIRLNPMVAVETDPRLDGVNA